MIPMIPGTKVYLACQPVSMRLGFDGLAARVAEMLAGDPFICVGEDYVAARPNSATIHAEDRNFRHIRSAGHRSSEVLVEVH